MRSAWWPGTQMADSWEFAAGSLEGPSPDRKNGGKIELKSKSGGSAYWLKPAAVSGLSSAGVNTPGESSSRDDAVG